MVKQLLSVLAFILVISCHKPEDTTPPPEAKKPATNLGIFIASNDGNLYALDSTGSIRWKYFMKQALSSSWGIFSNPTLYKGAVYVGGGQLFLYSLNAANGSLNWVNTLVDPNFGGIDVSTITIKDGTLFTNAERYATYAFTVETGVQKWRTPLTGGYTSPTVKDGVLYTAYTDGHLNALDATTGQIKWTFPPWTSSVQTRTGPTVVDGIVYAGSSTRLQALNASSGQPLWNYTAQGLVSSSPTVVDNVVYFSSETLYAYALDAKTGALKWRSDPIMGYGDSWAHLASSPFVDKENFYVGSSDSSFYCLNRETGKTKWKMKTNGTIVSSPVASNGYVYFGSSDKNIYCLSTADGSLKWKITTGGQV
ncbi:MAG: hypothetical protein EON98_14825, partial [Chitinophagaceae bacterium]